MRHSEADRALALGGLLQAALLARSLARDGNAPESAYQASVYSLLQLDAPDVPSVYDGVVGVALGLRTLVTQLNAPAERNLEVTRYAVAVLQLEAKLQRDRQRLEGLGKDLAQLRQRHEDSPLGAAEMAAAFAEIYQRHISTLSPRIIVKGEPVYLQNPDLAARIRTALLAGIRAAHLWRQCGGRRWQLLLRRRRVLDSAKALLDHIGPSTTVV
jgi:high frequency lysogenization protein